MSDLFGENTKQVQTGKDNRPLSEKLRPKHLSEIIGQDQLLAKGAPIYEMVQNQSLASMILWGPPGVGKTTIARLLAKEAGYEFLPISAVFSGVADLKKAFETAQTYQKMGKRTLLFVDEIHRFNRAQQDGFLPYVESGLVTLIGATTENPSFELNGAVLSRARVFVLNRLEDDALSELITRGELAFDRGGAFDENARKALIAICDGDGRYILNLVGEILGLKSGAINEDDVAKFAQRKPQAYDKNRDEHYNLISALHKSVRASDPDAALYWLARMLNGGENPLFIARRLIRMASEDIGLAEPGALAVTIAARDAYEMLGSPEGELALAQATLHLACCPKSNAAYVSFKSAMALAKSTQGEMPPKHFLNAPTKMMGDLGYGKNYQYDHDVEGGVSGLSGFPERMGQPVLFEPKEIGAEARIVPKLEEWRRLRKK
ncbi:MAG: replication-associated recombination protein A [Caulobacterales bacterium]|nr:replication-associated recombination protein A [Caulobacterales bacterium]MCA0372792.1 replication-associated recombination protein A [Pseudomonadota bacterium]